MNYFQKAYITSLYGVNSMRKKGDKHYTLSYPKWTDDESINEIIQCLYIHIKRSQEKLSMFFDEYCCSCYTKSKIREVK